MFGDIGLHTCDTSRHLNAKFLSQYQADKVITDVNLMAEPNGLDFGMAVDQVTYPYHWIGEIDKPGLGAGLLHVAGNFKHWQDVSGGMDESARATVFGIRLPDAIL